MVIVDSDSSSSSSSRIAPRMQQSGDDEPDKQKQLISPPTEPYLVGVGLENLSNNCYVNAALQCLTHTVLLNSVLFSPEPHNCGDDKFCVFNALKEHNITALTSEEKSCSPSIFVENLNRFSDNLRPNAREDAHEFLQAVLHKLEKCCWEDSNDQHSNFVHSIFRGLLVNGVTCCKCGSFSGNHEECLGLTLEVEGAEDLHSALDSHFSFQKVECRCDDCKGNTKNKKRFLCGLPEVMTLHLMKFRKKGSSMVKISDHVAFPLEIDFQPYMTPDPKEEVITTYYLYAFVEHVGSSLSFGHYRSYVRSAKETWHEFNDTEVNRINEDIVLSKDAYILFYAREGTAWFASVQTASPNRVLDRTRGKCPSERSFESIDDSASVGREKIFEKLGTTKENEESCKQPSQHLFRRLSRKKNSPRDRVLDQAKSNMVQDQNSSQNQQEGIFEKLGQHLFHKVFRKKDSHQAKSSSGSKPKKPKKP